MNSPAPRRHRQQSVERDAGHRQVWSWQQHSAPTRYPEVTHTHGKPQPSCSRTSRPHVSTKRLEFDVVKILVVIKIKYRLGPSSLPAFPDTPDEWPCVLQSEITQGRVILGEAAERPAVLALALLDRDIIDAGDAKPHQAATPKTRGASARLQAASAGARPIYNRGAAQPPGLGYFGGSTCMRAYSRTLLPPSPTNCPTGR
jgi:hypothetical protein